MTNLLVTITQIIDQKHSLSHLSPTPALSLTESRHLTTFIVSTIIITISPLPLLAPAMIQLRPLPLPLHYQQTFISTTTTPQRQSPPKKKLKKFPSPPPYINNHDRHFLKSTISSTSTTLQPLTPLQTNDEERGYEKIK